MKDDPSLAESMREDHRRVIRVWRIRQMADPVLKARYYKPHCESEAKRRERTRSNPESHAEYLRKQYGWYHSMSEFIETQRMARYATIKSCTCYIQINTQAQKKHLKGALNAD